MTLIKKHLEVLLAISAFQFLTAAAGEGILDCCAVYSPAKAIDQQDTTIKYPTN